MNKRLRFDTDEDDVTVPTNPAVELDNTTSEFCSAGKSTEIRDDNRSQQSNHTNAATLRRSEIRNRRIEETTTQDL